MGPLINIGANQMQYRNEFAMLKMLQISIMCVMTHTTPEQYYQ